MSLDDIIHRRRDEVGHRLVAPIMQCIAKWVSAAMLNRLLHHAHVAQILGDNYRLKDKQKVRVIGSQAGMEGAAV